MNLPALGIPAPWALGVVLGLVEKLPRPFMVAKGEYQVIQTKSKGDVMGACQDLTKRAKEKGLPLPAESAPWGAAVFRGPLGTVCVVGCQSGRNPKTGCLALLKDARADFSRLYKPKPASVHRMFTGLEPACL